MSKKGSVEQTGNKGINYEQMVQTAFLVTLIIRGNAPDIPASEITKLSFQTIGRYATNDILINAKSQIGEHRLLIECKDTDKVRITNKNSYFKEVLNDFWKDYNNPEIFDKTKDRVVLIKSSLSKIEKSEVKKLFSWARKHANADDFIFAIERSKEKKKKLDVFRKLLKEANNNNGLSDTELWQFLKCVNLLEYDFFDGGNSEAFFLDRIKYCKSPHTKLTAKQIWDSVYAYVSTSNWQGGTITHESIKNEDFYSYFNNAKLHPYKKTVDKLESNSKSILINQTKKRK